MNIPTVPGATIPTVPGTAEQPGATIPTAETVPGATIPTVETVPGTAAEQPGAVETVPGAVETVPGAVETVPGAAAAEQPGAVETTNKPKRLTNTAKWDILEPLINEVKSGVKSLDDLVSVLVDLYKPKSGGGGFGKDWSRRVEDNMGKVVAKKDVYLDKWFVNDESNHKESCFSKNKYVTKRTLKAIRDAEEDAQKVVTAAMLKGEIVQDANILTLFDPAKSEEDKFKAMIALYPNKAAEIVNDYNGEGKYLGENKDQAVATLHARGFTSLKISD